MTEKKKLDDEKLNIINGGQKESWDEWRRRPELRDEYFKKVLPFCLKHNIGMATLEGKVAPAVWYYEIPYSDIEAFILTHFVGK